MLNLSIVCPTLSLICRRVVAQWDMMHNANFFTGKIYSQNRHKHVLVVVLCSVGDHTQNLQLFSTSINPSNNIQHLARHELSSNTLVKKRVTYIIIIKNIGIWIDLPTYLKKVFKHTLGFQISRIF